MGGRRAATAAPTGGMVRVRTRARVVGSDLVGVEGRGAVGWDRYDT